jgi:hypothetical protein
MDQTVGDQALDLGRRQVVAGIAVAQAHIAADHEGPQARLGEAFCLCDAEAADHLHRDRLADPFEDGASHITEIIVLDEFRFPSTIARFAPLGGTFDCWRLSGHNHGTRNAISVALSVGLLKKAHHVSPNTTK